MSLEDKSGKAKELPVNFENMVENLLADQVITTNSALSERLMERNKNAALTEINSSVMEIKSPSKEIVPPSKKFRRLPFRRFIRGGSLTDVAPLLDIPCRKKIDERLQSFSSESEKVFSSASLPSTLFFVSPAPTPCIPPLLPPPPLDCTLNVRMQFSIVNELYQTEIEYVQSLKYVFENYVPEMNRDDLPNCLRGQQRIVFGEIENIYEFHTDRFLPDLIKFCQNLSAETSLGQCVADCFRKHSSEFDLYSLYIKNKPISDSLINECGKDFFRTKQFLLEDKFDLSSHLLKPVQRICKYLLFVQKLIKSDDSKNGTDSLKFVEEMLAYQLQRGNDLLAMDSIRNCNINLKEQGRLLRQEQFFVYDARRNGRKCERQIFLFENLILLAKPDGEFCRYKNSIKICDLGLTPNVVDNDLKFEIWYRRHTTDEIFIILAPNKAIKLAWICSISELLWRQVVQNRELRTCEANALGADFSLDFIKNRPRPDSFQSLFRFIENGFVDLSRIEKNEENS